MNRPVFMSAEHVAMMNDILAGDEASREACRQLDREYVLVYELNHRSSMIYWTTLFSPAEGVVFSLQKPAVKPDIVFRGGYAESIRAAAAHKAGQDVTMPCEMSGSEDALAIMTPILDIARRAATLDSVMPEV